jgi:hypothetical protein
MYSINLTFENGIIRYRVIENFAAKGVSVDMVKMEISIFNTNVMRYVVSNDRAVFRQANVDQMVDEGKWTPIGYTTDDDRITHDEIRGLLEEVPESMDNVLYRS